MARGVHTAGARYAHLLHVTLLSLLLLLVVALSTGVVTASRTTAGHAAEGPLGALISSRLLQIQDVAIGIQSQLTARDQESTAEPTEQAEQLYQTALDLYNQNRFSDALVFATRAAALVDAVPYLYLLAQTHEQLADLDTALQILERAFHVAAKASSQPLTIEQTYWLNLKYADLLRRHAIPRASAALHGVESLKTLAIEHYKRALEDDRSLHRDIAATETGSNALRETSAHMAQNRLHVLNTVGVLLNDLQRFGDAVPFFEQAIHIDAAAVQPLGNLALAFTSLGQLDDALQLTERALALAPDEPRLLHNMGLVLQSLGRPDDAATFWHRAHELNSNELETLHVLASAYANTGDVDTSRVYLEQAQAIEDAALQHASRALDALAAVFTNRLRLASAQLPVVYQSVSEVADARRRYEQALESLLREPMLRLLDPDTTVASGMNEYYAEYQGYNDAAIRAQHAQIYRRGIPTLSFTAPYVAAGRAKRHVFAQAAALTPPSSSHLLPDDARDDVVVHTDRRIRVGFLSAFMRHHSVGLLTQGMITLLDRNVFEVVVLVYQTNAQDELTKRVFASADRVVHLPAQLAAAQQQIAALELDVLVFTEIGMDQHSYVLAFAHLALRSALFWGHAVTSGIDTIDYFVTSTLFAHDTSDDQQTRFTECVYEMEHLTTHFLRPPLSLAVVAETQQTSLQSIRATLGLPPPPRAMILLPQTLYKLHPDMDALLERILQQASDSFLVVLTGAKPWLADATRKRWRRTLSPDVYRRVYFVRMLTTDEYLTLCAAAAVVLDPFPVGGGRSSFEIFAVGTPIVLLAPRTSILQLTAAMYMIMGFRDLIATTADAYVAIAVRLARDPALRAFYRRLILANCDKLFASDVVVREWERFFVTILAAPPPTVRVGDALLRARTRNECPQLTLSNTVATASTDAPMSEQPHEPLFAISVTVQISTELRLRHELQIMTDKDDPLDVVRQYEAMHGNPKIDWHQREFLAKLLWNGQQRLKQPVASAFVFDPIVLNTTSAGADDSSSEQLTFAPIEIRYGDDLQLMTRAHFQRELKRLGVQRMDLFGELTTQTVAALEQALPAYKTPAWLAARSFPLQHRFAVLSDDGDSSKSPPARDCVTLLMTTCKRLALFLRTIASLERVLGIPTRSEEVPEAAAARGWKRWFCQVVVVDDNSSDEDRAVMRARVPLSVFAFIYKSPAERGHAKSLILGLQHVQSRYMLYVEDDWEFTGATAALSAATTPTSAFLTDALAILRAHRTSLYEPLALVLLNDQQSGWERHLRVPVSAEATDSVETEADSKTNAESSETPTERTVRYFLHEFANADPAHTFSFWPGFSFNPGVWDLHAIRAALSLSNLDSANGSGVNSSSQASEPLFNDGVDLFEHLFSLRVWRSGLHVTYLDDMQAVHIGARVGTNASAYVLNGLPRRYDGFNEL